MQRIVVFILIFLFTSPFVFAQKDSAKAKLATTSLFKDSSPVRLKKDTAKTVIIDSSKIKAKPKHDPRIATFRSAVLPGWGQIYNREYWKLPIVYGALAVPAALYVYNNNYYKWTKFAYQAIYAATYPDAKGKLDTSLLSKINPKVKSQYITYTALGLSDPNTYNGLLSTYQSYRNIYKRNKDYSLLWFFILWGVNVADATVFAHLKEFDVSDKLTLQINPSYLPQTKTAGVGFVVNFKHPSVKPLPSF